MSKAPVRTDGAPAPVSGAPYSQAIVANGFVFVSGQVPIDPATGKLVDGGIGEQTNRCFDNLLVGGAPEGKKAIGLSGGKHDRVNHFHSRAGTELSQLAQQTHVAGQIHIVRLHREKYGEYVGRG